MATKKTTTTVNNKRTSSKKTTKASVATRNTVLNAKSKIVSLKRWNIIIAALLAVQAVVIILIGKASTLPVVTRYLANDSLATQSTGHAVQSLAVRHLFYIDIRYIILAFLLVSALTHWLIASIRRQRYEAEIQKRVNTLRWIDYGLSSGLMLILIAMLNGVYDSTTLLTVFVLVALLHLLAYFGESKALNLRGKLQAFVALCVAGGTVWSVIASYLKGALIYGNGLNHFVYWIDAVIFAITLGLAYNTLQVFRERGKWVDYVFGERIFMVLSFVAKTALTWFVFAGFLK